MYSQLLQFTNLIDMLENQVCKFPQEIGLTFLQFRNGEKEEKNITYKELYDRARTIAVSLMDKGLQKGDRVIIISDQTQDSIYSLYGAIFSGAIFTIIPSLENESKKQRFKAVLQSSGAKFILCSNSTENMLRDSLNEYSENGTEAENSLIFNINKCHGHQDFWVKPELLEENLAYLQYTSGSTSAPKGVMITYGNLYYFIESLKNCLKNNIPKTSVLWIPIFHNMGLTTILLNIYVGARSIILTPQAFMENPLNWLKAITEYNGEMTVSPNSAYDFCVKAIDDKELTSLDLSTIKYASNGSEGISLKTMENFAKKFGKCGFKMSAFCSGYGLAEATCTVSISHNSTSFKCLDYNCIKENKFIEGIAENELNLQITSSGKLINGLKAIIVNPDTQNPCRENELGEIWLQGPTVAVGYWEQENETADTFRGTLKNHDGFFLKTGDIGTIYEDELYIVGRLKEIIIINGHNLYPKDIETNLKDSIPDLRLSSIISFSKMVDGKERVVICIEASSNILDNLNDIAKTIDETIHRVFEFWPYDIIFIKDKTLPRTDNGKIQVINSKELYNNGRFEIIYSTKALMDSSIAGKKAIRPTNEIEEKILEFFKMLITTDTEISTDDNFLSIGGDSLSITRMTAMIEDEFGTVIPLKLILEDPTVTGISKLIQMNKSCNGPIGLFTNKQFLYNECELDESITLDSTISLKNIDPKNIFLTGSTGFVGAYLIKALMKKTTANIYCHVRAKNHADGVNRIISNAKFFDCWEDCYKERIIPVLGELSKPLLGMEESTFNYLSETIDVIYHNGAMLNFIYPYSYLKNINVMGTKECLRLACKNKIKIFNHVSTFSVFDNPSHFKTTAFENDPLDSSEGYFLGYTESKWVAEKLVRIAEKRGLKVCIYRPGEITGTKANGIWKMNDMVSRFIVAGIQMGAMPDVSTNIHMTPVDFIADSIVHLSLQPESIGKAFNLLGRDFKTVRELAEIIRSFGYDIEIISYEKWMQKLTESGDENALKLLEPLFFEEKSEQESITRRYADLEAHFDILNTLNGLNNTGIKCESINNELIFKYLNYFIKAGYINAPKYEVPLLSSR